MENLPAKRKVERSAAYPSLDLEEAVRRAQSLYDGLGSGPYTREIAAKAIGYAGLNGVSARAIAALTHYGLLDRDGNVYHPSELLIRILHPRDEVDKSNAVKEAIIKPKLFNALIQRYGSAALPSLLENILVLDYHINNNVAKDVVKTFKKSIEFVGILKNGVLLAYDIKTISGKKADVVDQSINNKLSDNEKAEKISQEQYSTPPLPSGIIIIFPAKLKTSFVLGDFATELKSLEEKAQKLLKEGGI